jgi:membrane fusion protein, copper/silver efflux system
VNKKQRMWIFGGLFILLSTISIMGWLLWQRPAGEATPVVMKTERKILYWHDPMSPGTHFDKPGKSPFMDMDLVPVYADGEEETGGLPAVTVRPEVINNLGVRTYVVTRAALAHQVNAQGYLFRSQSGTLMAQVDVFERETQWIRAGLPAELRSTDLPGQTFAARVESVDADVDRSTRLLKVRIALRQRYAALLPDMPVDVTLHMPASPVLAIPREAVIRTANRTAVVLAIGAGRFRPVDVVLGPERGDWVEIRQGLKQGDSVVVSGQFLIDSESSLRASFQRMQPPATETDGAPQTVSPGTKP